MPLRHARGQLRGVRVDDRRDRPACHRVHRGARPGCGVRADGPDATPATAPGCALPAGSVVVCGRRPKALRRSGSPGLASPAAALRSLARPVRCGPGRTGPCGQPPFPIACGFGWPSHVPSAWTATIGAQRGQSASRLHAGNGLDVWWVRQGIEPLITFCRSMITDSIRLGGLERWAAVGPREERDA